MPKKQIDIFSDIKDGRLQPRAAERFGIEINQFNGRRVHIHVEEESLQRTSPQNRYMHLMFTLFARSLNDMGNEEMTMERIKGLAKFKFALRDDVDKTTGETLGQYVQDTHDMDIQEMAEFIDAVIRWAADTFHIVIPDPDQARRAGLC